ncbi:MAG: hypothetical protein J6Q48_02375 [Bacteroidaceae bacterium]|nr:hypothetical protein [Bacteroidaceae bacterium]MBO5921217.1 hypothetical protein [Bacteroidaceae bacterium]
MKWLKSSTQKSWVVSVGGKQAVIPQCETPDNKWLSLSDSEWIEVSSTPVIASLIKAGGIIKLDEEPAELKNSIPALQVSNTHLQAELDIAKARILELEDQLKNASGVDIETIKAEVRQQCEEEKKKALEELDAKATQEIETRDKTIEKLEKKIKKLGGESDGE